MKALQVPQARLDVGIRSTGYPVMDFHAHMEHEIYYFYQGKCNYLIGGSMYVLQPGDLIIMNGLTLHRPKVSKDEPYVRSVIHFDSGYFSNLLNQMGMPELMKPFETLKTYRFRLGEAERPRFEQLLDRLDECRRSDDAEAGYRYTFAFLDLLAAIYGISTQPLQDKETMKPSKELQAERVVDYVEKHYMQDLTLDRVENELHLSKYYLSKTFKDVTGTTIFNYIYQRRVHQAKVEWLLNPERSVTDISYLVGFKHPAHFSRVFKQYAGCTPEQYKKRNRPE